MDEFLKSIQRLAELKKEENGVRNNLWMHFQERIRKGYENRNFDGFWGDVELYMEHYWQHPIAITGFVEMLEADQLIFKKDNAPQSRIEIMLFLNDIMKIIKSKGGNER